MAIKYTKGDEPVPGYRLVEFLGRGGFGEVWKAMAPGRAEVALKIIALDQKQGMKEFKSLRLVKTVRHPNLVPINAFWLKDSSDNLLDDEQIDAAAHAATVPPDSHADNQVRGTMLASAAFNRGRPAELIIAMGLGDMNLFSRLQECQSEGRDGIAPDELLEYMDGSAKAIDFLNSRHNIQHCDIKPQNIMIVGGLAQVCDFGLARELGDARMTGGAGTIAYGAPELLWDNKASAGTDQYSLALTFYELRTGRLPFPEDSAQMAVMMAHRDGKLDLSGLSEDERAVIKRATSPDPSKRFAQCADMVRALRRAWGSASQLRPQTWVQKSGEGVAIIQIEPGSEIVPGYTLVKQLFRGGSSEVWEATAGNNIPRALLIRDVSRAAASVDPNALALIQGMDHPHLTQVLNFWLLDDVGRIIPPETVSELGGGIPPSKLVIAGKLAHSNLLERLEECRKTRESGIPPEELLGYMYGVASAVDELNAPKHQLGSRRVSVQHCNLRPVNLLLYEKGIVRIGNLARARVLDGASLILPPSARDFEHPFCAPELVDGELTRSCDQYALAVSYVQMRTAHSAFDAAASTSGLASHQRQGRLNLTGLGANEKLVIQRAIARKPEERFENCGAMVIALEEALQTDLAEPNQPEVPVKPVEPGPEPVQEFPPDIPFRPVSGDVEHGEQPHLTTDWEAGVSTGGKTATKTNDKVVTVVAPEEIKKTPGPDDPQRRTKTSPKPALPDPKVEEETPRKPKRRRVKVSIKIVLLLCPLLIVAGIVGKHIFSPEPKTPFNRAAAIARQEEWLSKDNYADAFVEYQRLGKEYPGDSDVEKLGSDLFQSLQARVESLADAGELTKAALVYQSCKRSAANDDRLASARELLIERGSKYVGDRLNEPTTVAMRDIEDMMEKHRGFTDKDSGAESLNPLLDEIITRSVARVDAKPAARNRRKMVAALGQLAGLAPGNSALDGMLDEVTATSSAPVPTDDPVETLLVEAASALDADPSDFNKAKSKCDEAESRLADSTQRDVRRAEIALTRARLAVRKNGPFDAAGIDVNKLSSASDKALFHVLGVLAAGASPADDERPDRVLKELASLKARFPEALDDLALQYPWESGRIDQLHGEVANTVLDLAWSAPADAKIRARVARLLPDLKEYGLPVAPNRSGDLAAAEIYAGVSSAAQFVDAMKKLDRKLWRQMTSGGVKSLAAAAARWAIADGGEAVVNEALAALTTGAAARGSEFRADKPLAKLKGDLEAAASGLHFQAILRELAADAAPSWRELFQKCDDALKAPKAKIPSWLAAGWVECLIESKCPIDGAPSLSQDDWRKAADLLDKFRPEEGDAQQRYFDYASALVERFNPDDTGHDPAADLLVTVFEGQDPGLSDRTYRKKRAITILVGAANRKSGLDQAETREKIDPPFAKEVALQVEQWLTPAREWLENDATLASKEESSDLKLNLAAAVHFKTPPSDDLAASLSGELVARDESKSNLALLINAEAMRTSDPSSSIARYAELYGKLENTTIPDKKLYGEVLKPALSLTTAQSTPAIVKKERIAQMWARKGRLLGSVAKLEPTDQAKLIYEAFDFAAKLDPGTKDYFVDRGFARMDAFPFDAALLKQVHSEDIVQAIGENEMTALPAAIGLRGRAYFNEANMQASLAERIELCKKAVRDCEEAIKRSGNACDPRIPQCASGAYLLLANYDSFADGTRKSLEQAVKFARLTQKNTGRPQPHAAWDALGNAEEDFAWWLKDLDGYERALKAFNESVRLSRDNGWSPALSLMNRGRCRYKQLAAEWKNGDERDRDRIRLATEDLKAAIDCQGNDALLPSLRAEAHRWLANVYRHDSEFSEAEAVLGRSLEGLKSTDPSWYPQQFALLDLLQQEANALQKSNPQRAADATTRARRRLEELLAAPSVPGDTRVALMRSNALLESDLSQRLDMLDAYLAAVESDGGSTLIELLLMRAQWIHETELWADSQRQESCKQDVERALNLAVNDKPRLARALAQKGSIAFREFNDDPTPANAERVWTAFRDAWMADPREDVSWKWRYYFAQFCNSKSKNPSLSAAQKASLKQKGFDALNPVKNLRGLMGTPQLAQIDNLLNELR